MIFFEFVGMGEEGGLTQVPVEDGDEDGGREPLAGNRRSGRVLNTEEDEDEGVNLDIDADDSLEEDVGGVIGLELVDVGLLDDMDLDA